MASRTYRGERKANFLIQYQICLRAMSVQKIEHPWWVGTERSVRSINDQSKAVDVAE